MGLKVGKNNFIKIAEFFEAATIQFIVPDQVAKLVQEIASHIPKKSLNIKAGGIETQPHITVLYGVADNIDLARFFLKPCNIVLDSKVTYFDNPDASVAKIELYSDELEDLFYFLKQTLPNQHSHDYNPHITIAYLKPLERLTKATTFPALKWVQNTIELHKNGLKSKCSIA